MKPSAVFSLAVPVIVWACSPTEAPTPPIVQDEDSAPPTVPPPQPDGPDSARLAVAAVIVSGHGQSDTIESSLRPYVVRVTDSAGAGVPGHRVLARVLTDRSGIVQESTLSDASGLARIARRVGDTVGVQHVEIRVPLWDTGFVRLVVTDTVLPGQARYFRFTTSPGAMVAGDSMPAIRVQAYDRANNAATRASDTLRLGATVDRDTVGLGGTTALLARDGQATFEGVTLARAGVARLLVAYRTSRISSDTFVVTPGTLASLRFTRLPGTSFVNFPTSIEVTGADRFGNPRAGLTDSVRLELTENPTGARLDGEIVAGILNGTATFFLMLDKTGAGYRLTARAGSLATATSDPFTIRPGDGEYHAIDLGHLGGGSTMPAALNEDVVTGSSKARDGANHAFIWNGRLIDLGTAGGTASTATHIAADGRVAGYALYDGSYRYVVWHQGTVTDLGPVPGIVPDRNHPRAEFIRGSDDLFGNVGMEHGSYSYHWDGTARSQLPALTSLGWTSTTAVNSAGVFVGVSFAYPRSINEFWHPFVWRPGEAQLTRLPLLPLQCGAHWDAGDIPCQEGGATDINDAGVIVGGVRDSTWLARAVRWINGRLEVLETIPGWHTSAAAITEGGRIAGVASSVGAGTERKVFVWENGVTTDIGSLGGQQTYFMDMNERGIVVGSSKTAAGQTHAFVWVDGRMIDLGARAAGVYSEAVAINERGDVLGWSADQVSPVGGPLSEHPRRTLLWRIAR